MSRLLALSCNNSIGNTSTVCAIQLVVDCLRLLMGKLRAEDCEDREDRRPDTGLGSGISYPMFAGEHWIGNTRTETSVRSAILAILAILCSELAHQQAQTVHHKLNRTNCRRVPN